jgi:hypothetical protein
MPKFSLDYSSLDNSIYKKAYKLSDIKDKIVKVGFDIVRFKDDDNGANLWQIQNSDDGDYIVAIYQNDEVEKTACPWEVALNKAANSIQVYYKGDPIVTVATSKLGIPSSELSQIERYLPSKLAENKKLVRALLNEMPQSTKNEVLITYPELA